MAEIYEPLETIHGFNFGSGEPSPSNTGHENLAGCLFRLLDARNQLEEAMKKVPGYTGQWDNKDYYADEQETYNRAVDAFGEAVKATRGDIAI